MLIVTNVVASANVGAELDLISLNEHLLNSQFNPRRFPAVILRLRGTRATIMLFRTGKILSAGAKSLGDAKMSILRGIAMINKVARFKLDNNPQITIHNIAGKCDYGFRINLTDFYQDKSQIGHMMVCIQPISQPIKCIDK
eukprot:TRINITY_DN1654_c0_g1_i1.p1 TRINITY_DN1654_c0_g1~~TRINITY_DN1654_c0_g1_i1.p1  ORF type:complete len:141 (-),score=25.61 TRINITY_DN1654_c0_g1_i1:260-682(-)